MTREEKALVVCALSGWKSGFIMNQQADKALLRTPAAKLQQL